MHLLWGITSEKTTTMHNSNVGWKVNKAALCVHAGCVSSTSTAFCKNIPCVLSFIPPESVPVSDQISVVWSVRDMVIQLLPSDHKAKLKDIISTRLRSQCWELKCCRVKMLSSRKSVHVLVCFPHVSKWWNDGKKIASSVYLLKKKKKDTE